MKKKDFLIDLQKKTLKQLINYRNEMKLELFNLKMKNSIKSLKETTKIKLVRRNIARINTLLHSKSKIG